MGQKVTIGGDRIGSGRKMQAELHNYYRSTHNLSEKFKSTMAPGVLYPAMVKIGLRGDTFDINMNADIRTVPTNGPLFGSFKMQVDVYQCPIRLYQGILHNNPVAIGLKMNQVLFPKMELKDSLNDSLRPGEMSGNCLMKYLGMSGIGTPSSDGQSAIIREVNALPMLAYYDIFKTYYANKQEEKGYVISAELASDEQRPVINSLIYRGEEYTPGTGVNKNNSSQKIWYSDLANGGKQNEVIIEGQHLALDEIQTSAVHPVESGGVITYVKYTLAELANLRLVSIKYSSANYIILNNFSVNLGNGNIGSAPNGVFTVTAGDSGGDILVTSVLKEFDLANIDEMRYTLLSAHTLGQAVHITDQNALPYKTNCQYGSGYGAYNGYAMNGLVVKTYQNDIFNNWLNTEWIEGDNGVKGLTDIDVSGGTLSVDSINLAEKLYNMLNRVALAGNTYEDWQDVVYEEVKRRQIESPMFVGGMSREVVFDEIVQSAPVKGEEKSKLGTLGGRGRFNEGQNGGHITVKCDEACIIMAIVSLTPRICYTQGNEWYLTELESMDDLHKPALDGIGFQDLVGERLAWWDTKINPVHHVQSRTKIGKLPAWIEYMTSYDRAFGEFTDQADYMVLSRRYERTSDNEIGDATTYIDPSKFNYVFAYTELDAQNFWAQINFDIKARRLMSARLIPSV